jgi:ketopantoate reductase
MEVEAMLAEPLRRAQRAAVAMPSVSVLHHQLAFLDARIARSAQARRP